MKCVPTCDGQPFCSGVWVPSALLCEPIYPPPTAKDVRTLQVSLFVTSHAFGVDLVSMASTNVRIDKSSPDGVTSPAS
jgi:hypothetical protein